MFKIILCLIKCCWLSVIKYCRLKPFYCVGPQKCLLCKGMCTLSWFLHENFWDCVTGKRGHSQSVAWYIDEEGIWFGLEEKKKKSVNRFFTLFPVVVWEVASETVSALSMLIHLFSFGSGGEYLYHRVTSLQKHWFCNNRVVQERCNQFERQWLKQAEITLQLLKGFMWPWWFTPFLPLWADSTRRDTVQRRHQHLQQDWKQRASPANVRQWITRGLIAALIPQVFGF